MFLLFALALTTPAPHEVREVMAMVRKQCQAVSFVEAKHPMMIAVDERLPAEQLLDAIMRQTNHHYSLVTIGGRRVLLPREARYHARVENVQIAGTRFDATGKYVELLTKRMPEFAKFTAGGFGGSFLGGVPAYIPLIEDRVAVHGSAEVIEHFVQLLGNDKNVYFDVSYFDSGTVERRSGISYSRVDCALRININGSNLERLAIRYHLTGRFSGYGGYVRTERGTRMYAIPTVQDGQPAETLKAIVYAPDSRFVLIEPHDLSTPLSITLQPQRMVPVSITIEPPIDLTGLKLDATYLAPWAQDFFGYLDGPTPSFDVASALPDRDGRFRLTLPDLTRDPAVKDGEFDFLLRDAKSGNIRYRLTSVPARKPLTNAIRLGRRD